MHRPAPTRPPPSPRRTPGNEPAHLGSTQRWLEQLKTHPNGLSSTEAARRLAEHGPNEIQETQPIRPLTIFLTQFNSLLVWILILAGGVAAALGEGLDAIAILAIVLLNGVIGFTQEFKAEKSIAALRQMTAPQARVRRDGKSRLVPAAQLVPGDVLELEAGDLVAADARLLAATSLRCIEATLTGESEPVNKNVLALEDPDLPLGDRANMVFKGTSVAAGQGAAVI